MMDVVKRMNSDELEALEIRLLLEALLLRTGYDFRSYAPASIERRTRAFRELSDCPTISHMIPKLLHNEDFLTRLVHQYSITVTEMFRDPFVYAAIRRQVIPQLKTWPYFKVWHAGCASGEEVYSMAIVLKEENAYERATIYATDFNDSILQLAREGVYPLASLKEASSQYHRAEGRFSLADYYSARFDAVAMTSSLRERVTFANHNLATDSAFGEMHLIFCRNVLIYFNRELQNRVLKIFTDSLVHGGFLCLGTKESIRFSEVAEQYDVVDHDAHIYKKKGEL